MCLEFGKDTRKTEVSVRVLYGLKSAGEAFRRQLTRCMESMGCESCKADLDLWLKLGIKLEDGGQYYSYRLCYMDDILCIHHNVDAMLERLQKSLPLKVGFCIPDMYLGAKLNKTRLHNGVWALAMSLVMHIWEAVKTVQSIWQPIMVVNLG